MAAGIGNHGAIISELGCCHSFGFLHGCKMTAVHPLISLILETGGNRKGVGQRCYSSHIGKAKAFPATSSACFCMNLPNQIRNVWSP